MLAKKTYKNQVTIPKQMMSGLENIEYFNVRRDGSKILLEPVVISTADEGLEKIRRKIKSLGITENDVQEAIRWARKKRG